MPDNETARPFGTTIDAHMPVLARKALWISGGVLLLALLTVNLWVHSLADAVIDQVVVPLTRLLLDLLS